MSVRSAFLTALREPSRIRGGVTRRFQQQLARSDWIHDLRFRRKSRQAAFTEAYATVAWGSTESGSGLGSELRAASSISAWLPDVLSRLGARSILDAPCGDWNWMQHVDLSGVEEYYGVDIVGEVIATNAERFGNVHRHFAVADLTCDPLPSVDAILCRDLLVHVSYQDAALILDNFRSTGAKWLLLNTYPEVKRNRNQFTGAPWRRLNFRLAPFAFPESVEMVSDGPEAYPSQLAVWPLQDLPRILLT